MCTGVCMKGARQQTYGLQETLHAEMSHTLPGPAEHRAFRTEPHQFIADILTLFQQGPPRICPPH